MTVMQKEIDVALRYHQAGDFENARVCYRKILNRFPDDYDALHMLGVLNYQTGNYDRAIALLEKAIKQNICAEVLVNLGNVFTARGDISKARDAFLHAVKLNKNMALAHFNLGNTYKLLEDNNKAIESYKCAIEIAPDYYDAIHNIAILYKSTGMYDEAEQAGLKATALNPNNAEAQFNLAGVYTRLGKKAESISAYEKTLKLDPDNMTASHLLSALTGITPEKPPNKYIADLFDDCASTFDDQLINKLKYRTPQIIFNSVVSLTDKDKLYKMLDLGCGTGLCGKLLKQHASYLAGVDLSSNMVDIARELNVYHDLQVADIQSYLDSTKTDFDIVISADVFVYVGELEPVFKRCKSKMKKKGLFVFSIEEYEGDGYKLLDTGRYAHSVDYIREISDRVGFSEISVESLVLREQAGKPIHGCIFILENR